MPETVKDAKLTQYLNEAYGKEKELETSLAAHIAMTTRDSYQKRLKQHLKETKDHAKRLERRIKQISGSGPARVNQAVGEATGRAKALAKGPLHMVRGTGEAEKMLKNAKTEYFNEHEEIATYTAIETLAESVGDKETAKLARDIRRDEERMAKFLVGQIETLTRAVVSEEIPSNERVSGNGGRRRSSSSSSKRSTSRKSSTTSRSNGSSTGKSGSAARKSGSSARKSGSSTRKSGSRAKASAR